MEQTQEKGNSVISDKLIFIDEEFSTKNEVIEFIVDEAEKSGYISDFKNFYVSVQKGKRRSRRRLAIRLQSLMESLKQSIIPS